MEGLRGLAVLLVFFVHYHALFGESLPRYGWLFRSSEFLGTIGNCGVDLFFVMSGYLIYGALIRKEASYLKFIRRRIHRIYPVFLAVFLLYLGLSAAFPAQNKIHGPFSSKVFYVGENLLLLPGVFNIPPIITVAWSLSYEFLFYLALPVVVWVCRMRRWTSGSRLMVFLGLWLIFVVTAFNLGFENRARMLSFLTGIILFELMTIDQKHQWLRWEFEWATIVGVISALVFFYEVHRPRALSKVNGFLPVAVVSAAFFFLSLASFRGSGVLTRVFSIAPIRYLGNMSYSYYLIHGLTLQAVALYIRKLGVSIGPVAFGLVLPVAFGATWIASSALFFGIERRYSFRRKLIRDGPTPKGPTLVHAGHIEYQPVSKDLRPPAKVEPSREGV